MSGEGGREKGLRFLIHDMELTAISQVVVGTEQDINEKVPSMVPAT